MYAELARVAELSATSSWPIPAALSGERALAGQAVRSDLTAAGWACAESGLCLAGQDGESPLTIHLDLPELSAQAAQRGQLTAQTAALRLLAATHAPLRRPVRCIVGGDGDAEAGDVLFWQSGWGLPAGEGGLILLSPADNRDRLVRLPVSSLMDRARNALANAGIKTPLYLQFLSPREGLGFLAAGRPERNRAEMALAIKAYVSLLYGLTGYGVLAFQFDLDFLEAM